jgi:hypothetical protein
MAKVTDLTTLAKTSVASTDYLLVTNSSSKQSKRLTVETMFPSVSTAGTSSETLYTSATLTNKNQIVFKGLKSDTTSNLTVGTTSNNLVLSLVEAGIDLNSCDNTTSLFMSGVDFTKTVTSQCPVVNGGTGLSTIAKGAMLYASATDTIAATSAMSTNGQLLIGNASNGYPSVATLTAGSNVTITNAAGAITIASSLGTMAANLDMYDGSTYTYNIDLNEGNGWISGSGIDEGITVDGDGKVFVGEGAPVAAFADTLNIKGGIRFTNTDAPTIKPTATTNSTSGQSVTIESGGSDAAAAGNLLLTGGTAAGNGAGGDVIITAGRDTSGSADGDIQLKTYTGSSATAGLTVGAEGQDVTVNTGSLVITGATEGIVHTGSGTVTQTSGSPAHTDAVTINASSGIITLAAVALAATTNAEFIVTNSYAKTTSVILVSMQDENTTNNKQLACATHTHNDGNFTISIVNPHSATSTGTQASKIHFLIVNPS